MSDTPEQPESSDAESFDPVAAAEQAVAAEAEVVEGEVASPIDERVAAVSAERDQYKDQLQRLQADFENFRKRMQKQQLETVERSNEAFASKLLPILDTLELAKAHEPSGPLEQISVALVETLNKEGLERINAINEPFDPNLHDAVAHEDGEVEGGPKVSEELRAGYSWKGRVLRPTMVKTVG